MAMHSPVVVLGGGPGGYAAAFLAADLGLEVTIVEADPRLGGTCLLRGCIPSKAMLESSELYHRAQHEFAVHGIKIGSVDLDLASMQKRRAQIVKQSTLGIASLFKGAGVTGLQGHGRLLAGNRVEFTDKDGKKTELTAKHVVLAAGSAPIELKSVPFDGDRIVDSWPPCWVALLVNTLPTLPTRASAAQSWPVRSRNARIVAAMLPNRVGVPKTIAS